MSETKETPDELTKLKEENKKLAADLVKVNEALAKNAELVKQLNETLAEKESENESLSKYPIIAHKGKKYELVDPRSRARYKEENYVLTKEELEKNPELLEFCISKGFSCLRLKGGN